MAQITFNIATEHLTRLVDAMCGLHNYQAEIPDPENFEQMIANPETRPAFAKRKAREWMVAQTKRWEEAQAKQAAESALTEITVSES